MNRLISDILNAPEPQFSHAISHLESLSGTSGHDLRLLSDIAQAKRAALQALELDESDTAPGELYYALRHKAAEANNLLEQKLSISNQNNPAQVISKIIAYVDALPDIQRDVWVIKSSVVKKLLKNKLPKNLMKALGLRSADSMLKRGNPYELLALSYGIESPDWRRKYREQFKRLNPTDFQQTKSSLILLDESRLKKIRKSGYKQSDIVLANHETGSILVAPPVNRFKLDTLAITLTVLHVLRDMRQYSAYFRYVSVKPNFGTLVYQSLTQGLPGRSSQNQIGWKALHRHSNERPQSFEQLEQPHLQHEDMVTFKPLVELSKIIPSQEFWHTHQITFMQHDGQLVSLQLMDVLVDASNGRPYENATTHYLQSNLWETLAVRYLQHEPIRQYVITLIDDSNEMKS